MVAAPDIFLSYSREDLEVARHFAAIFEQEGFTVWWDATLHSGDAYDAVTEEALATAKAVVVLWSPTSVASRWVRAEATEAIRNGTLVPVMIEPCKRPVMFELTHTAELAHWAGDRKDAAWQALVEDVRRFVGRASQASAAANEGNTAGATAATTPAPKTPPRAPSATGIAQRLPAAAARRLRWWKTAAAALAVATLALLALLLLQPRQPATASVATSGLVLFPVPAPDGTRFINSLFAGNSAPVGGAISPDGRILAFTAMADSGEVMLWIRPLDSTEARMIAGTEDAALPFWSPDSRSIAFFTSTRLKRVDVSGGAPVELCASGRGQGGSWSPDGFILFSPNLRAGLLRVSVEGGQPEPVLRLAEGHSAYRFPQFLADGRRFLYYAEGARPEDSGIYLAAIGDTEGRRLLEADSVAVPAGPDQLLFVRGGILFAQRFDAARPAMLGEPVRIAQGVPYEGAGPAFSASASGVLSYRAGPSETDVQQFSWFDRTGKLLGTVGSPADYRGMDLSPDGTRIAVHPHQGNDGDIWVIEPRGTATRITFDPKQDNSGPIWSPDGRRIAFSSLRDDRWGIYETSASGDGRERLLYESEIPKIPGSWSPDGRYLVYWLYDRDAGLHPWLLDLVAGGEPRKLIDSKSAEIHTQISPDGRWVAYTSMPSGRAEIYVRAFPEGEEAVQVSTAGGLTPRWSGNGRELFYWTAYAHGKVMAVPVDGTGGTFRAGTPQELFGVDLAIAPHSTAIQNYHTYDVTGDGQRFVIPVPVPALGSDRPRVPITVVLNWTALLPRTK